MHCFKNIINTRVGRTKWKVRMFLKLNSLIRDVYIKLMQKIKFDKLKTIGH